jgi:hypothetical protein
MLFQNYTGGRHGVFLSCGECGRHSVRLSSCITIITMMLFPLQSATSTNYCLFRQKDFVGLSIFDGSFLNLALVEVYSLEHATPLTHPPPYPTSLPIYDTPDHSFSNANVH